MGPRLARWGSPESGLTDTNSEEAVCANTIRLVGAILADLHDEWQATDRHYLSEDSMNLLYPERDSIATVELTTGH